MNPDRAPNVYRLPSAVPDYASPPNPHKRDGKGYRECEPPGWWRRLFGHYPENASWTCDCGRRWVLYWDGWARPRFGDLRPGEVVDA